MEHPKPKSVVIIGAGFSGLTLAALLEETKLFNITLYERRKAGGCIGAVKINRIHFENAAPSLLYHHELENFISRNGVKIKPTQEISKKRYVFYEKAERWPLGVFATLRLAFAAFRFLIKPNKAQTLQNLSVKEWGEIHLGTEFTDKILRPALYGIYASDIADLSAELVLNRFFNNDSKNRSRIRGSILPEGGLTAFLERLKTNLMLSGVQYIERNLEAEEIVELKENNLVIFATSFADFVRLIEKRPTEFLRQDLLSLTDWHTLAHQIKKISLVKVHLLFRSVKQKVGGFGVLFHPKGGFSSLGVIANSNLFSEYGPEYNESWILNHKADSDILGKVLADRRRLFGSDDIIEQSHVTMAMDIYPVYDKNLLKWLKLTRLAPGYFATGNYWGALGLTQIFLQNVTLTERIKTYVR